jgi:hypothetical protein
MYVDVVEAVNQLTKDILPDRFISSVAKMCEFSDSAAAPKLQPFRSRPVQMEPLTKAKQRLDDVFQRHGFRPRAQRIACRSLPTFSQDLSVRALASRLDEERK